MKKQLLTPPKGYKAIPRTTGTIVQASLMSQLYHFELVAGLDNTAAMWAKEEDIKRAKACPVILCHALEHRQEEDHVFLLGPLPVPYHGSYAFVQQDENLLLYFVEDMPEGTKLKHQQVRQKIIDLAEQAKPNDIDHMWVNATPLHKTVADEPTYHLFRQQTISNILSTSNRQEQQAYDDQLNKITLYHDHVIMIGRLLQLSDYQDRFQEIARMMQDLAADYYEHHQKQIRPLPEATDIAPQGYLLSSTAMAMQIVTFGVQNATAKEADQWIYKKGHPPYFQKGSNLLEYKDTESSSISETESNKLWEQVKQQTDLQIDMAFAAISFCIRSAEPDHSTWIYAEKFLESRGLEKSKKEVEKGITRTSGYRPENYQDVARALFNLEKIWITIQTQIDTTEINRKNKKRRKRSYTYKGRFIVVKGSLTQKELGTTDNEKGPEVAWHIAPGDWLATFLDDPNRQVANLSDRALKYDPHNQRWEKYLARYFFFNGHMSSKGSGCTFNRYIGRLLQECSLEIEEDRQQRMRDRFEKAMNKITEDGFISAWHYTDYPNGYTPTKRSWLNEWLEQRITVDIAPAKRIGR
jgi:hypothetical protein